MLLEPLAPFTSECADFVQRHAVGQLLEIGAGRGEWARGVRDLGLAVSAVDIRPKGEGVDLGDHTTDAPGDTMLAVWPPDGYEIQAWIAARPWACLILAFSAGRLIFDNALEPFELVERLRIIGGRRDGYSLYAYRRVDGTVSGV